MMDPSNRQLEHDQVRSHFDRAGRRFPIRILAQDLEAPANVGSLFRIADALGVEHLYLTGSSARPPNAKIRKTSRATEKYVPYSYSEDALALARELARSGFSLVSLEITASSRDVCELVWDGEQKLCLIVGSERTGVGEALLDLSDHTVHIPMFGENSSMNVATACAIAVFEITRGRQPGGAIRGACVDPSASSGCEGQDRSGGES